MDRFPGSCYARLSSPRAEVHKYELAKAVKQLCWPGEFRILWKALDKAGHGGNSQPGAHIHIYICVYYICIIKVQTS